jgi:hypothetical protein
MPYPVSKIPFDPRDYASHQSLLRVAAFVKGADAATRQAVIDYVVTAHAFAKDDTKSIVYAASLNKPGQNVAGNIQIGPPAFEQDLAWLAGIVFHELIHSPQYAYYAGKGVTQIDPKRSETERLMIALDEYEAYCWSLKRSAELALSESQQAEIRRRAQHALIDLDDSKLQDLARSQRFNAARDELILRFNAKSTGKKAAAVRRNPVACYA